MGQEGCASASHVPSVRSHRTCSQYDSKSHSVRLYLIHKYNSDFVDVYLGTRDHTIEVRLAPASGARWHCASRSPAAFPRRPRRGAGSPRHHPPPIGSSKLSASTVTAPTCSDGVAVGDDPPRVVLCVRCSVRCRRHPKL